MGAYYRRLARPAAALQTSDRLALAVIWIGLPLNYPHRTVGTCDARTSQRRLQASASLASAIRHQPTRSRH
jgi:hypothetical protein